MFSSCVLYCMFCQHFQWFLLYTCRPECPILLEIIKCGKWNQSYNTRFFLWIYVFLSLSFQSFFFSRQKLDKKENTFRLVIRWNSVQLIVLLVFLVSPSHWSTDCVITFKLCIWFRAKRLGALHTCRTCWSRLCRSIRRSFKTGSGTFITHDMLYVQFDAFCFCCFHR